VRERLRLQPRTLRGRVSVLAIIVIAGWLVVLATGLDVVLSSRLDKQVDDALKVRAQAASVTLDINSGRVVGVHESATDSTLDSSIWIYSGTRVLEQPKAKPKLRRAADSLARSTGGYADRDGDRFYVLPIRSHGRQIGAIVAAIDLDPYHQTRETAILGSIVVAVLLLAGAYPVLRIATGRALRPVAQMTRQAAEWSVNAPSERFGAGQQFAELSSLAGTLDELLDRLAAVLRHERHLSAELSHELRTPLARVMAEVDLMLDHARPDQRAELLAIRENCSSMDRIIDTLLAAARSELVSTVGRCDLGEVLGAFATNSAHPAIDAAPTALTVGIDADVVVRMLAPIVENARRYARRAIHLEARRRDSRIEIDVSNDGERLSAEIAERVFQPGFRGTAGDDHKGAGLGLPLARRLARAADGDLLVVRDAPQTTFRLLLPAG
jgi:signal transduction histidine kinase